MTELPSCRRNNSGGNFSGYVLPTLLRTSRINGCNLD